MTDRTPDLIVYVGGPLDGRRVEKLFPGKASIYRDDHGNPITTAAGDREFLGGRPTRHYVHSEERHDPDAGRFEHVYVHATARPAAEGA